MKGVRRGGAGGWAAGAALGWLLAVAGSAVGQTPWAVKDAAVRAEVRLKEAPSDPELGEEIDTPDFALPKPGANSYALTDAAGRPLPVAVVWQGEGRDSRLLARDLQAGQAYFLYIGGAKGEGWKPEASLWREVRRAGGGGGRAETFDTAGAMQTAWNSAASQSEGAAFVPQVFEGDNPYGEPSFFLSHFSGYLAPTAGEVELFSNSADASYVLVNDQPFTEWTGAPSMNVFEKDLHGKKLPASATPVKIDYYQAKAGGTMAPNMTLGWRRPGERPEIVPASAFLHAGKATVERYEARDGGPVPAPAMVIDSYLGYGAAYLYEVRCRADGPAVEWRFDDGAVLTGADVTRVMSGTPGTQHVTVIARNGAASRQITRRIGFYGAPPREAAEGRHGKHGHEQYVAMLLQLDPSKLDAPMLAAALPLLFDYGTDTQTATYADAWLAKKPDLKDPLWLPAYRAHVQAAALTDPKKTAAEIAANTAARQFYNRELDGLELDVLALQAHDLASLPRVRQLGFDLGSEKGKIGEIRLGDLYRLNGDLTHAAEHYRAAQPPDASAGRSLPAEDQAFALTIEDWLADGARQDAMDKLGQWEIAHPMAKLTTNYPVLRARALALFGRWRESLNELNAYAAAHQDDPYTIEVDFYRARALYESGGKEEARKIWRDVAKNYPKSELAKPSEEWAAKP